MKINSIYRSNNNEEFECIVHIENGTLTRITSTDDSREFKAELEKLQPSILGTEHFSLWKNKQKNGYPYYIVYKSSYGQKSLCLDFSKLNYLITKQLLKIKFSYLTTSFILYSFLGLIGIFSNIMSGEFVLSQLEVFIFIWCILAFSIMWKLNSKVEKREKEIISLKKKILEYKVK